MGLQSDELTHLPIAWKPWGPVAGKAKSVNASTRYLCSVGQGRKALRITKLTGEIVRVLHLVDREPDIQNVGEHFLPDKRILGLEHALVPSLGSN
jgi:hypothetical protein